jgi:glycosyltransferase involved in cell wall biosynthesis
MRRAHRGAVVSDARFVFVVGEGPDATVIDSQVVDTVVAVGREGVRFDLLFLTNPGPLLRRRAFYTRRRSEIAARTGGAVRVWPAPHPMTRPGAAIATALVASELARSRGNVVVHARTDNPGWFASRVAARTRRFRYVYDARGDFEGEYRLALAGQPAAEIERVVARGLAIRQAAIDRADHVLCVSTVLRDRLVAKHGLDPARATVVPCVADATKFGPDEADRRAARSEHGLDGRFVVVYPGRFGAWHYNEETFAVVRGLMDADASVFFLILTPDTEAAAALAARTLPPGRFAIHAARHQEVPRWLRASDLGVLLRAPDPLNEVACPTKFAEYVMTGLPVLISAGIGDCSPLVATERAGAVLAAPDPAASVAAVAAIRAEPEDARRARIAAIGAGLSRQRFASRMAALYRAVAEAP